MKLWGKLCQMLWGQSMSLAQLSRLKNSPKTGIDTTYPALPYMTGEREKRDRMVKRDLKGRANKRQTAQRHVHFLYINHLSNILTATKNPILTILPMSPGNDYTLPIVVKPALCVCISNGRD